MKRIFLFGFFLLFVLAACNNDSGTGSSDAAGTEQNSSSTSTDMASTASANANTPMNSKMPFMAVMDKMMKDMHSMKMTEDPDHDFAMMMKSHHQGAIGMSNIELAQGKNDELKQVAQKIIDDSQKDIKDLDAFMSSHQPQGKSDFAKRAMDKMMSGSSGSDMSMHSGDVDRQFAMMMAMHHKQGIDMAKEYLKSAKAQQTKAVANRTIKANSADLPKLQEHGGSHEARNQPDSGAHASH